MGYSGYSHADRSIRTTAYQAKKREEIFSKSFHESMNPNGVTIRESRDSDTHPLSVPIIIAMDVTGSMGFIPENLIKTGLPHIISGLMEAGIKDPQILFLAIGDHITDKAPLQVSQFESGDAELDMWLERTWIEGRGGGNGGESYALAWYFAAKHTATDHWDKRGKKGFLFTIGDERNHSSYPATALQYLMGGEHSTNYTADDLQKLAEEKWNVFHILPGMVTDNSDIQWREKLGERAFNVEPTQIAEAITKLVVNMTDFATSTPQVEEKIIEKTEEQFQASPEKKFL